MGLDQMAYKIKGGIINEEVPYNNKTNGLDENPESGFEEICSWRKHYELDDWMTDLYWKKGGKGNDGMFNCCWMKLSKLDLTELEVCLLKGEIAYSDWPSEIDTQKEYDLNFIKKAKKIIEDGFDVFYSNWW
jgi:hypothetical protein